VSTVRVSARRPSIAATRRLRQDRQCDAVEAIPHLASNSAFIELPKPTSWIDERDAPCLVSLQSIVLDPSGIVLHDLVADHDVGNPDQGTRGSIRPARSLPHDTRLTDVA
jgi:hypothetical protein